MISLKGKVAIVTGAASGIGAATAKLLASAGAAVMIADLNLEGAKAVVDEIRADGQTAEAVRADVSEEDEVRGLIEATRASFGRLDILDNNAGLLGSPNDLDVVRMDVDLWDRFFAVNTRGPMLMCKHAIPLMIEGGGGSIINIASSGTSWGNARSTAYYCSKNAVIALTRFVAMQHIKDGIRCNTVSPGMVGSESARQMWKQRGLQDAIDVRLMRDGEALDLARVVLFLASELSEFMTGQLLTVDGGLTAGSPLFPETQAALQITNPRPAANQP
jgi:NAD(P)-dependent dehydrogenase (short-subunit alcohol dehydrogenase family)